MPYQSVIIPTCNHPDLLKRCLAELLNTNTSIYDWEILIVDNSEAFYQSQNRDVVQSIGNSRIRHIEMAPFAGLMAARHLGAEMAQGEILSFIDDDSFVEKTWVQGVQDTFMNTNAAIVGGSNIPEYEAPPPAWLDYFWDVNEYGRVCRTLSLIDFGPKEKPMPTVFAFGCNISIRKEVFWRVGGSNPDYLPPATRQYQGDGETGLSVKVEAHGGKAIYRPDCSIRHYVPKDRLTMEYFGNRAFFAGLHNAYTQIRRENGLGPCEGVPLKVGVKRSFTRRIMGAVARRGKRLLTAPSGEEKPKEVLFMLEHMDRRYKEGWSYLRNEVGKDPLLFEYVLRKNYLGDNAKIPGEVKS